MLKQQFNGVKKVLAISLAVLFVASLTIASASACTANNIKSSHCDKESCWSKENSACKTCGEDNGNGVCKKCGEDKENGVCKKCASHNKHNHKNSKCSKKNKKCSSC